LQGFTLIELLVVIAMIAILAAILFPVYARVKARAKQTSCLENLKQIGVGFQLYLTDSDERLPDRRDLKRSLPGGYKPWTSWPTSDPRGGWAALVLKTYTSSYEIWNCPSILGGPMSDAVQVVQALDTSGTSPKTRYWLWRFDRPDNPVPPDNFWGKSPDQATQDLAQANNPQAGVPQGEADVELAVDPYFPETIPSVDPKLKGLSTHDGGRNRLFLDNHVKWLKDIRTH